MITRTISTMLMEVIMVRIERLEMVNQIHATLKSRHSQMKKVMRMAKTKMSMMKRSKGSLF